MDEAMEKVRFIERRLIFVDDLKNLCEDKKLYTMGDEECLAKMLNKCKKPNITTEDIIEIAKDIQEDRTRLREHEKSAQQAEETMQGILARLEALEGGAQK